MSQLRILRIRLALRTGSFRPAHDVMLTECRSGKCGRCHRCKPKDSIPVALQPRGEA